MLALITLYILCAPLAVYVVWQLGAVLLSLLVRSSVRRPRSTDPAAPESRAVALLYPTCDDFRPDACASLVAQRDVEATLFILDDSSRAESRRRIDRWASLPVKGRSQGVRAIVVRRRNRSGFKGGNINHWLARHGASYPFALIVDADEIVHPDFTHQLLCAIEGTPHAFVQACHIGDVGLESAFQRMLHLQVECEWLYQVPARNLSGVPPMLGHGVLIRTEDVHGIGGFPPVVSEDLGLTILLAEHGLSGLVATDVIGREEFPRSYRAYWKRRFRWIQADAEVVLKMLFSRLWRARISVFARVDLTLRELRLPLGSLYWGLLIFLAIRGAMGLTFAVTVPATLWLALLIVLAPVLPAPLWGRGRPRTRYPFPFLMCFVGATTIAIHPVATALGLAGQQRFDPTGNQQLERQTSQSLWELASGLLTLVGGVGSHNLALAAFGVAIVASPVLRMNERTEWVTMTIGTVIFWAFICIQIALDCSLGPVPIEHVVVFVGLCIVLI